MTGVHSHRKLTVATTGYSRVGCYKGSAVEDYPPMTKNSVMADKCSDWRRRHAVQIAAQLPENINDALHVLALAKRLVERFLAEGAAPSGADDPPERPGASLPH